MKWADTVKERLNDINVQESLRVAGRGIVSPMRKRIFDNGINSQGSPIGNYSTEPLYINKNQMRKTEGGRETRGGKTKFFAGGYKAYKDSLGDGGKFNMRNFGVMMRDFSTPKETLQGKTLILTFKEDRNKDIIEGDKRMQAALGMTTDERKDFQEDFTFELNKRLFKA